MYKLFPVFLFLIAFFSILQAAPETTGQPASPAMLFKQGCAHLESGRYREAASLVARAWQLEPGNHDYRIWHMRLSMRVGQLDLIAGRHAAARAHFASGLAVKQSMTTNRDDEWTFLRRLSDLTDEHEKYRQVKPDHVYRFQVLYLLHTDISNSSDWRGRPVTARGTIGTNGMAELEHNDRLTRVYLEALSRGRLSLAADHRVVDTTLTRVLISGRAGDTSIFNPDLDSCVPSLAPLLFAGRNTYDTTVFYWYGGNIPNWAYTYWGSGVILHPYTWHSPATRPQINYKLAANADPHAQRLSVFWGHWVHIHEFFHLVEQLCGNIGPEHAHLPHVLPVARTRYPAWVPDMAKTWGSTEYSWFRYHFLNTVPKRMEELAKQRNLYPAWRNMSFVHTRHDRTDERVYTTYTAALSGISFANLRKAGELVDKGNDLARSGKGADAIRSFEQALVHNPYHRPALDWLGWHAIASMNNNFARADRFYARLAAVFPDPRSCFNIGLIFFERGQPALAARYFRVLADQPGANPVYTAWLVRALTAAKDGPGAAAARTRLGKHQIMNAPLAVIDSSIPYTGLRTVSNPEDDAILRLWGYPHDPSRIWRLVPAGSGGEVRIVSDFNWKCLEDRGDGVALVPIGSAAAQRWTVSKIADGSWRIQARTSGRLLTVIPGAAGKDPCLTLLPAGDVSGQRWKIEIQDPLVSQADALPPAMLRSTHTGLSLNLWGGNHADGTRIGLWNGTRNEWNSQWKLLPARADGWVLIICPVTKKCMGTVTKDGHTVPVQQTITHADTQLWRLAPGPGGTQRFVNKAFGLALQPDPWDKNALTLLPVDDNALQLWKIEY